MKSPCFSDKLVYQRVNLVGKKIYPPLVLAVGRLILTGRIHFLLILSNSESSFVIPNLFILHITPAPKGGITCLLLTVTPFCTYKSLFHV